MATRIAAIALLLTAYLLPLTGYPSPLTAQQARTSWAFELLRDSLGATSDTAVLRATYQENRRTAALRAGLAALRLGELHTDPDFGDALSSFRQATRANP